MYNKIFLSTLKVGHKNTKHKKINKADSPINNTPNVSILKTKFNGIALKKGIVILNKDVSKIS
jgi:hypothetical protein